MLLLEWRPEPGPGDDVAQNLYWLWELHTEVLSLVAPSPNIEFQIISHLESDLRDFGLFFFCSCPETAHLTLSPVCVCIPASDAFSSLTRLLSVRFLLTIWLQPSPCASSIFLFFFFICFQEHSPPSCGLLTFPWTWLCWVEPVVYTGTFAVNTRKFWLTRSLY